MRGRIPDATSNLATKRVQIEQFFQDNRTFVGAPACASDTTSSKYFTFVCSAATVNTYTLQATGIGAMNGFTFTLDQSNNKTTVISTTLAAAGWSGNTSCWIVRKGAGDNC
jgi:type IV pilus assembly protein PilE